MGEVGPGAGPRTVDFQTSLGTIPVTGVFGDRFKVLAITGAWAPPSEMSRLAVAVAPDFDGVVATLPGNRSPALAQTSIPAWATAFDEVVDQLGPTLVLGMSIGALVALGMRSPVAIMAIEPPLSTRKLWPMLSVLRDMFSAEPAFVETVFGYSDRGWEDRDYRFLLDGLAVPTDVLVGDSPLFPERPTQRFPSVVDEPERVFLAAHPRVTLHTIPNTGHNVPSYAGLQMLEILMRALRACSPDGSKG